MLAGITDVLWTAGTVAAMAGLVWLARRIDPHWAAKDGRAFTCRVQSIRLPGADGSPGERRNTLTEGNWRNSRAVVAGGRVRLTVRGLPHGSRSGDGHPVLGRGTDPPARKVTFLLGGEPLRLLSIPARSPAVAVLDSLVGRSADGGEGPGEVGH
jgi:hypothetical protein